ncbi:MAG: hypothetical protein QME47_07065 [Candidatus Thermoplasmatota archaeon]|nr:hypothetical protein [Candidatus Thermoplasmatota archaeon]
MKWKLNLAAEKENTKKFMKTLVTILVIVIIISVFYGLTFIRFPFQARIGIAQYELSVQFMACDYATTGSLVIQNESYSYRLKLGSWAANTTKTYPAAFAIVNPHNISITIRKLEVKGALSQYVRVYLHKNYTRPCNSSLVTIAASGCEQAGDYQKYYEGYSIEYDGSSAWKLSAGWGYNATKCLTYGNSTSRANASFFENVWFYDESYHNLADNDTANFVWVEVSIAVPSDATEVYTESEIIVIVDCADAPPKGPEIDFMACDRIGGGYVLTGYTNRSVRFNLGEWYANTSRSFPGAFAIVNAQSAAIRIEKIEVIGDGSYLRIYLHKNRTKPCNSSIVAPGIITETSDDMQLYYDGSTSIAWGSAGWKLAAGLGYNETNNLIYTNGTYTVNATRIGGFPDANYYFWLYSESAPSNASLANNDTANFVWVEIDVVVPPGASSVSVSGELIFYFRSI